MSSNACAFSSLFLLTLAYGLVVWALAGRSARALVEKIVKLPEATAFYGSAFFLALFSLILSQVLETSFKLPANARLAEYFWEIAEPFSDVLEQSAWLLVIFILIMTVLVAVLKRRNDS